ncbi:uncharacterized protein LOC117643545 isoform X2 [Thrips palmi]|nr:uncharacterized protein LOC117643545 isoform X2 [Thrips palmi]XP_034238376.1 uncharacterized protein LOC117643545 isoform X2 [Thrips palmi]XP_034238377.1 uncharacterized protein LOC117643545 isoform X2 [Thrips palmi]
MSGAHNSRAQNQATSEPFGNAPRLGHHNNPQQHYQRAGTPPDMYMMSYGQQTPPTPPGSVCSYSTLNLDLQSKCSFCNALGCELYTAKKTNHELMMKLMAKNVEIERLTEEALACRRKKDTFEKKYLNLEEMYSGLEEINALLMQERDEQESALQRMLANLSRNSSLVSKINNKDETDSVDSSESEESSSKPHHSARKGNDSRTGRDQDSTEAMAGFQGRTKPTEPSRNRRSNAEGEWNNQEIRPNRNLGPRPNPHRSSEGHGRSQDGSKSNENRFYQAPVDRSKDCAGKEDGSCSQFADVVREVKGDLFDMPVEYALAHCVGSDFIMSSGVAVNFRKKFRQVPELLEQNKRAGQVAFINCSGRYIYYLVTKLASTGKPTWEDFESAVIEWSELCVEHNVTKIAIPKIGCGRDQLDWSRVKNLLNKQFSKSGIEITVCLIDQEAAPPQKWNLKLVHHKGPLSTLDPRDCALVFIASKDNFFNESIRRLASKYGFTSDYNSSRLGLGSVYQYTNLATKINVFGLVVKEKHDDPISFTAVGKCLQDLRRISKKMKLYYMGFEAFDDPKFVTVTRKLWTAVIDTFFIEDIEVYFCWPEDVKEKNWEERALH